MGQLEPVLPWEPPVAVWCGGPGSKEAAEAGNVSSPMFLSQKSLACLSPGQLETEPALAAAPWLSSPVPSCWLLTHKAGMPGGFAEIKSRIYLACSRHTAKSGKYTPLHSGTPPLSSQNSISVSGDGSKSLGLCRMT